MEEKYHTVKEIANRFRVSRQAVYDWIESGQLRAIKLGSRVRVSESALNDFVQSVKPGEKIGEEPGQTWAAPFAPAY